MTETEKGGEGLRFINKHCFVAYLNLALYTIFCGGIQILVTLLNLISLLLEITS